jgi:hypothetical protein
MRIKRKGAVDINKKGVKVQCAINFDEKKVLILDLWRSSTQLVEKRNAFFSKNFKLICN